MPTLSFFYGIVIAMFTKEHPPPHFHARYAEHGASYDIASLTLLHGYLPPAQERLVLQWAREHQMELQEAWSLCQTGQSPFRIAPLKKK